jgi:hypothetical protein
MATAKVFAMVSIKFARLVCAQPSGLSQHTSPAGFPSSVLNSNLFFIRAGGTPPPGVIPGMAIMPGIPTPPFGGPRGPPSIIFMSRPPRFLASALIFPVAEDLTDACEEPTLSLSSSMTCMLGFLSPWIFLRVLTWGEF